MCCLPYACKNVKEKKDLERNEAAVNEHATSGDGNSDKGANATHPGDPH